MSDQSTTTAVETTNVSRKMWDMYNDVEHGGMTVKAASEKHGYSGGGGGAAVKRVRDAIKAGHAITVDGDPVNGAEGTGTVLSRDDIAESILEGASYMLAGFDRIDTEQRNLVKRATRLEDEAAAAREKATNLDEKRAQVRDLMSAAGFDWDEFDAQVAANESPDDDE